MFDRVLSKLLESFTEWKYQGWSFSCVILSCLEKCYENHFGLNWLSHWNSDATWTWSERFKEFVPSQYFNVVSTLLQRCVNADLTLKTKQNMASDFKPSQCWYNAVIWKSVAQRDFNVNSTLIHYLNVVSTWSQR